MTGRPEFRMDDSESADKVDGPGGHPFHRGQAGDRPVRGGDHFMEALRLACSSTDGTDPHLTPGRIIEIAHLRQDPDETENQHLESCPRCRKWWVLHKMAAEAATPRRMPEQLRSIVAVRDQAVAFPDGSIAFESTQFGRMDLLRRRDPLQYESLLDLIAEHLADYLKYQLGSESSQTIVLAAFGNVVYAIAQRTCKVFVTQGWRHVHAVAVHGIDDLKFECAQLTFRGSRVVCLCDVAHTGTLVDRMARKAEELSASGWVHRVALVKQVDLTRPNPTADTCSGLWVEERETRYSLEEYRQLCPGNRISSLRLFEPELGRADTPASFQLNSRLQSAFLQKGVIEIGKRIDGTQYPYTINTLRLLGIEPAPTGRTITEAPRQQHLFELPEERLKRHCYKLLQQLLRSHPGKACLVYHEQRACRAGRIARLLSRELRKRYELVVPAIGLGWKTGSILDLTRRQVAELQQYDTVIMVDAAMRTGTALTALHRAIRESGLNHHPYIAGLVIVASKWRTTLFSADQDSDDGFEVFSPLPIPLLPPIADMTERMSRWKQNLASEIERLQWPEHLSDAQEAILHYCRSSKRRERPINNNKSDQVLTRFVAMPWLRVLMKGFLVSPDLDGKNKARAAIMLMALDEFDWLGREDWVCTNLSWFARAKRNGYWRVFLLAILWLQKRRYESDCPTEVQQDASAYLQRAGMFVAAGLRQLRPSTGWSRGDTTAIHILVMLESLIDWCLKSDPHTRVTENAGRQHQFS